MLTLAKPYADEPLSSALIRGCRHFGLTVKQVLSDGGGSMGVSGGIPFFGLTPLSFFAALFRMPPEVLWERHTVLPYATAFSARHVWEKAVTAASCNDAAASQTLGAVVQSAIHGLPHRRFCRTCVRDDLNAYGETYWHLSHQLPGSLVCSTHGEALRRTSLRLAGRTTSYELPQDCVGPPCITEEAQAVWNQTSVRVAQVLRRGLVPPPSRPASYYRDLALERGWLRLGRNVSSGKLGDAFALQFGAKNLKACGVTVSTSAMNWANLMLHADPKVPFVTLKHVLMEQLLNAEPGDLSHVPGGPAKKPTRNNDQFFAAAFSRVAQTYAATGKKVRAADLLKEAGCWGHYRRHGMGTYPLLHTAVRAYGSSHGMRPQALRKLLVPGGAGALATRQDLVRSGHLLSSKEAAVKLGVPWPQMKVLQRSGRILCVRYARRDWYPAFWCESSAHRLHLERVLISTRALPLEEQWRALLDAVASDAGCLAPQAT